jgi:transposase
MLRRIVTLLMLDEGFSIEHVGRATGLTRRAIEKIRTRWHRDHLRSLVDQPRSGRPPLARAAYRRRAVRTLETCPLLLGYGFTVWTTARLAEHLFRKTRVRLSPQRLRQMLQEEEFTFGIPAHTLKGKRKERRHRRTQKRLKRLKKGHGAPTRPSDSAWETKAALTSILI